MTNDGFTLAELSIASSITILLFSVVLMIATFANRQFERHSARSEVATTARLISSQLSLDLRHARTVRLSIDKWEIVGQNGTLLTYRATEGKLYRQDRIVGMSIVLDSFALDLQQQQQHSIATFSYRLISTVDSTIHFDTATSVVLRGAPVWPVAEDLDT
jgi:hypothetical protein